MRVSPVGTVELPTVASSLPQFRFERSEPLCFIHIPKTGGTTVRLIMQNAFDGSRVHGYEGLANAIAAGEDLRRFDAISSHDGIRISEHLSQQANFFTWLREPRDRLLSHFFFFVVQEEGLKPNKFAPRLRNGERLETVFIDWLLSYPDDYHHLQGLLVAGWDHDYPAWRNTHPGVDLTTAAIEVVRRCFFFGLVEDHETSIDAFCALTSILPPKRFERRNRGTKRSPLSFTLEEQRTFDKIVGPEVAFYEHMRQVYRVQMNALRDETPQNTALVHVGNRDALRRHLLDRSDIGGGPRPLDWDAWNVVRGENLDSREYVVDADGVRHRWRWTCPSADTYLQFRRPVDRGFEIRVRLNSATPFENAAAAQLIISGYPVELRVDSTLGKFDLVGEMSGRIAATLPDMTEFHIHTPIMLDESKLVPYAGTRKLGLAIEAISARAIPWRTRLRRTAKRAVQAVTSL